MSSTLGGSVRQPLLYISLPVHFLSRERGTYEEIRQADKVGPVGRVSRVQLRKRAASVFITIYQGVVCVVKDAARLTNYTNSQRQKFSDNGSG
jgi:hypothetical protein